MLCHIWFYFSKFIFISNFALLIGNLKDKQVTAQFTIFNIWSKNKKILWLLF